MIYYYYVYLILTENRLVITENEMNGKNYHLLMNNNGVNKQLLFDTCKIFCLGYLYGSTNGGRSIINNPHEFT